LCAKLIGRFEAIAPTRVADVAKSRLAHLCGHVFHSFAKHPGESDFGDAFMEAFVDCFTP
jgi:hypothetical protein